MMNGSIAVRTPYGQGVLLECRPDGIVTVQLTSACGKSYRGYFHMTQVRQLHAQEDAMEVALADGGARKRIYETEGMVERAAQRHCAPASVMMD